jgi:hypothetical protein
MWYKPAAALVNTDEEIPISKQAYDNFLDNGVSFRPFLFTVNKLTFGHPGRTHHHNI